MVLEEYDLVKISIAAFAIIAVIAILIALFFVLMPPNPDTGSADQRGYCEGLSDDACNFKKAIDAKDSALCGQISDEVLFNSCIYLASGEQEGLACELFRGSAMEECLAAKALQNPSLKTCSELSEEKFRDKCLEGLLEEEQSYEICNAMLNIETAEKCIVTIAIDKGDLEECQTLSSESLKAYCQQKIEGAA